MHVYNYYVFLTVNRYTFVDVLSLLIIKSMVLSIRNIEKLRSTVLDL